MEDGRELGQDRESLVRSPLPHAIPWHTSSEINAYSPPFSALTLSPQVREGTTEVRDRAGNNAGSRAERATERRMVGNVGAGVKRRWARSMRAARDARIGFDNTTHPFSWNSQDRSSCDHQCVRERLRLAQVLKNPEALSVPPFIFDLPLRHFVSHSLHENLCLIQCMLHANGQLMLWT